MKEEMRDFCKKASVSVNTQDRADLGLNSDPYSGSAKRYWAHVDLIQREVPKLEAIPEYYRNMAGQFKTWFRVIRFEEAPKRNI